MSENEASIITAAIAGYLARKIGVSLDGEQKSQITEIIKNYTNALRPTDDPT
jgi:hypothetical protein